MVAGIGGPGSIFLQVTNGTLTLPENTCRLRQLEEG